MAYDKLSFCSEGNLYAWQYKIRHELRLPDPLYRAPTPS